MIKKVLSNGSCSNFEKDFRLSENLIKTAVKSKKVYNIFSRLPRQETVTPIVATVSSQVPTSASKIILYTFFDFTTIVLILVQSDV